MALAKETVPITFAQGRDGKTDPWQIPIGKFYALNNSVFTTTARLTKRNGFLQIASLPAVPAGFTTFQGGLTSIGSSSAAQPSAFNAYSSSNKAFALQGPYLAASLSTEQLIRSNANQIQSDSVTAPNGMQCVVYTEETPTSAYSLVLSFKYAVFDSTGFCVVKPTAITPSSGTASGSPRVFLLGNYFVIVATVTVAGSYRLQYLAVPVGNPAGPLPFVDITTDYSPLVYTGPVGSGLLIASALSFDGVVAGGNLYLAWNTNASGIKMTYLTAQLAQANTVNPDVSHFGPLLSMSADTSGGSPVIWATYYDAGASTGYTLATDEALNTLLAATLFTNTADVVNLATVATGAVSSIYYEVGNAYAYDSSVPSNFIKTKTVTQTGTVGTSTILCRGMGLAAKAFWMNGLPFVITAYQSPNQSTYFLVNGSSGAVVGKLAYGNAEGYVTGGLPTAQVVGQTVTTSYLLVDLLETYNKTPGAIFTQAIYSQTGINSASWNFAVNPTTLETAQALHISGAQLWMYDGTNLVEHGFHLWPDMDNANPSDAALWIAVPVTPTGTTTSGSKVVTAVSSMTSVVVGMAVSGTGIAANSIVTAVNVAGSSFTLNLAASSSGTNTLTIGGSVWAKPDGTTNANAYYYQVLFEWMDAQGNPHRSAPSIPIFVTTTGSAKTGAIVLNIPTLRATLKTAVKIVIYRWSVFQQTPFQITNTAQALLNDPTVDFVSFADINPDANILGNSTLYTFGGIVENTGAPATSLITEFDGRLWLVPSEVLTQFWFSQPVIPGAPVEMSNLLTYTIPPAKGAEGDVGDVMAIAPMDEKFVYFKSNASIYYITGEGPDLTGANSSYSQPIPIASSVGAINPQIGIFEGGLLFQSDKGIWALRRNTATDYAGAPVEDFNSQTVLSTLSIPDTTQVRFVMSGGTILSYDWYFDQWSTFIGPKAVLSTLFQGLQTYVDAQGRVFQETPGAYMDGSNPVLMSFTTGWLNPAGLQGYQRAYWAFILGRYLSPHTILTGVAYDYNPQVRQQFTIKPDNFTPAWGRDANWGSNQAWGGPGDVEQWQINFKQTTCQAFQLTFQEQYDPSKGQPPGAGFTLSGIDLVVGLKKRYPRGLPATRKTG